MPLKEILLTDEELATQAHAIFKAKGMPIIDELRELTQVIAKAQLKKALEYIGDELICGGRLGEPEQDGEDAYFLNAKGWQALLDEVKDG